MIVSNYKIAHQQKDVKHFAWLLFLCPIYGTIQAEGYKRIETITPRPSRGAQFRGGIIQLSFKAYRCQTARGYYFSERMFVFHSAEKVTRAQKVGFFNVKKLFFV